MARRRRTWRPVPLSIPPRPSNVERAGASDSFLRLLLPAQLPPPLLLLIEDLCGAASVKEPDVEADCADAPPSPVRRLRGSARKGKRLYEGSDVYPARTVPCSLAEELSPSPLDCGDWL